MKTETGVTNWVLSGSGTYGYRMFLQLIAYQEPTIITANLTKVCYQMEEFYLCSHLSKYADVLHDWFGFFVSANIWSYGKSDPVRIAVTLVAVKNVTAETDVLRLLPQV